MRINRHFSSCLFLFHLLPLTILLHTQATDSSPVTLVRASLSEQYALIVFKDKAPELWDLSTLQLLKVWYSEFWNTHLIFFFLNSEKLVQQRLLSSTHISRHFMFGSFTFTAFADTSTQLPASSSNALVAPWIQANYSIRAFDIADTGMSDLIGWYVPQFNCFFWHHSKARMMGMLLMWLGTPLASEVRLWNRSNS